MIFGLVQRSFVSNEKLEINPFVSILRIRVTKHCIDGMLQSAEVSVQTAHSRLFFLSFFPDISLGLNGRKVRGSFSREV